MFKALLRSASRSRCHGSTFRTGYCRWYSNSTHAELPHREKVHLSFKNLTRHKHEAQTADDSPVVVMIHGLFGSKQNWVSAAKHIDQQLQHKVKILGVDMRNHGDSPHAEPLDYTTMTSDLIEFLESHVKREVVLVGHSMGAKVSMLAALTRPDLVAKLVVIDNSPVDVPLPQAFARDLEGMCEVELQQQQKLKHPEENTVDKSQRQQLKEVDNVLKQYEPDKLTRVFLMANLTRSNAKSNYHPLVFRIPVLALQQNNLIEHVGKWPLPTNWSKYTKPVMVMRGLQSPFVKDEHLANDFPRYFDTFSQVDFDCGHALVSEDSAKFVKEMVEFLKK